MARPPPARISVATAIAALVLVALGAAAAVIRTKVEDPRASAAALIALGTAVSFAIGSLLARHRSHAHDVPGAAVFAMTALLLPSVFGCAVALRTPIFGTDKAVEKIAAPIGIFGALPLLIAIPIVVGLYSEHKPTLRSDATFRRLGLFGVLVGALLLTGAALRARLPDPDGYLASLSEVRRLKQGDTFAASTTVLRYTVTTHEWRELPSFGRPNPSPYFTTTCTIEGVEPSWEVASNTRSACPDVVVRADALRDYVALEVGSRERQIVRTSDGARMVSLQAWSVRDRLSPPIGWTIALAGTLPLAGLLLAIGGFYRRRAEAVDGTAGHHSGGGWIVVGDDPPLRLDEALGMPLGPVVLAHYAKTGGSEESRGYRGAASTVQASGVEAGTLEDVRRPWTAPASAFHSSAALIAWLGVAPMLVAFVFGLVV